jgi:hypothetical protein
MAKKAPDDLDQFQKWVKTIPKGKLVNLLCDAYWKRQIDETELRRAFLLSKKGVDMINGSKEEAKAGRGSSRRRAAKPQVSPQRRGRS